MTTSLITTAIPYVNAAPHLGFAYELVLADILARHRRRRGFIVRFVNGTDENSLKNVAAAAREGVPPRVLVDRNAAAFEALGPLLGVEPDDFVRTSTDPRHRIAVEWLWRACRRELVRARWEGRYCAGCEAFVDDDVEVCAEHHVPPEPVSEDNWFFPLGRYRDAIRDAITSGRLTVVPETARVEVLAFLDGPVRDLSVSRDARRAHGWGIPVPDDPTQVIYVWFDALASYLTSLGLGGDPALLERYWRQSERIHVIGKGIARFHAVYWPAFLLAAGLPLPDQILVHGYLTIDGIKIAKTGPHVAIDPIVRTHGRDSLRWYFARRCRTRGDADVKTADIAPVFDADFCNGLGNLVQRCTALASKLCEGRVPASAAATGDEAAAVAGALRSAAEQLPARVDAALADFLVDDAAAAICALVAHANRALETLAPWQLARVDPDAAASALHAPLEAARIAAAELSPFVPEASRAILDRLGGGAAAEWGGLRSGDALLHGPPLFPRRA